MDLLLLVYSAMHVPVPQKHVPPMLPVRGIHDKVMFTLLSVATPLRHYRFPAIRAEQTPWVLCDSETYYFILDSVLRDKRVT